MVNERKNKFSTLKVIAIISLLIGAFFTSFNFVSPHHILVKKSIQVPYEVSIPNETILGSKYGEVRVYSNIYFPAIYIEANKTFQITWVSIYFATAYIFTQQQFNNYQSNASFDSEASVTTKQDGSVAYDVKDSGYYVAELNVGANQYIIDFNESVISYTNQTHYMTQTQNVTQKDNLYLYLGITLLVAGTISLLTYLGIERSNSKRCKALNLHSVEIA